MAKKTDDKAAPVERKLGDRIDCPRCRSDEHAHVSIGPSNALEVWCENCKSHLPLPA